MYRFDNIHKHISEGLKRYNDIMQCTTLPARPLFHTAAASSIPSSSSSILFNILTHGCVCMGHY